MRPPNGPRLVRGAPSAILLAIVLFTAGAAPAATDDDLDRAELEQLLNRMQTSVDEAVEHYAAGDVDAALEDARSVRDQFAFDGSGASELETRIKAISAVAIGDRVKALSTRLVTQIESGAPIDEVQATAEDLAPSLNHLVLVAQGKAGAAARRQLRDPQAIEAAMEAVLDQVRAAVDAYRAGDAAGAQALAEEAFFTFETNGLGPDTSTVDDDLENEVENLIVNFDSSSVDARPGLSQLIERGAPVEDVQAQADAIADGLTRIAELLEATIPPLDIGDANGDGRVSIVDALLVAQAALGVRSADGAMDANGDGRVTIVDALLVAQAALGIRSL